ncbi:MAG TPA: response regulator transcription factor [Verrucomicrobiota bacterium]|nr:response regulator transcription factor [Verrucomicrobiota bacterium]
MIKVLIADDHAIVRKGLRQILADTPDIIVEGEATHGVEVLERLDERPWDVLVLDISMPGRSGLEVLKDIKKLKPRMPVLVLSMHAEEQFATRTLKAGASGYLNKESAPEELVKAIRKVHAGGKYVSAAQSERMVGELTGDVSKAPHERLSDREFEILCLIASGRTPTQIAKQLSLSVKTVSTYRSRLLEKMGLSTNAQITHYAIKNGLVD